MKPKHDELMKLVIWAGICGDNPDQEVSYVRMWTAAELKQLSSALDEVLEVYFKARGLTYTPGGKSATRQ